MHSVMDIVGLLGKGDSLQRLSAALSESPSATRRGLEAAIPLAMAGLASLFSGEDKAAELMSSLRSGSVPQLETSRFEGLVSDPTATDKVVQLGKGLMGRLFGGKVDSVVDILGSHSGVSRASASTLLSFAGPLLLGELYKQVQDRNLDTNGLSQLLRSEGRRASSLLPDSLSVLLGTSEAEVHTGTLASAERRGETPSYAPPSLSEEKTQQDGDAPTVVETPHVTQAIPSFAPPPGAPGRTRASAWMWMAVAVAGVLLFGLYRRGEAEREQRMAEREAATSEREADDRQSARPAEIIPAPMPEEREARSAGARPGSGAVDQNTALDVPTSRPPQAVRPTAESGARAGDGQATSRFAVRFATNSDRPRGHRELERAVAALQKDSEAKAVLKGYADPLGDEAATQALSAARVEAVRQYLLQQGIPAERIETAARGTSPRALHAASRRVEIVIESEE